MTTGLELERALTNYVEARRSRLIDITRELIRIPSENTPPKGEEARCQTWIAEQLSACGLAPDVYELGEVVELTDHPLYLPGRDYTSRPNVGACRAGIGGGPSLLLSGHIDTVPAGTQPWTRHPFGGDIEGNRLYGRGSNDMKAGIATNLFVMECVRSLDLSLAGDLFFESVVDEEFGGSNGTLAARLRTPKVDAAVLSEPSFLRICPAQRGGRTAHITFRASGGILENGRFPSGVVPQLTYFLTKLETFRSLRQRSVTVHEMYAGHADPVPVSITKVFTAPWGFKEPITVPESVNIELYWQLMPGETQPDVEREFLDWFQQLVDDAPDLFSSVPSVTFPIRWLPGSAISRSEKIVQSLYDCAETVLGSPPAIAGIEGPCDLFLFQQAFAIPTVIWGARGGNTHAADEYVEIESLVAAAKTLLLLVVRWCGQAWN